MRSNNTSQRHNQKSSLPHAGNNSKLTYQNQILKHQVHIEDNDHVHQNARLFSMRTSFDNFEDNGCEIKRKTRQKSYSASCIKHTVLMWIKFMRRRYKTRKQTQYRVERGSSSEQASTRTFKSALEETKLLIFVCKPPPRLRKLFLKAL